MSRPKALLDPDQLHDISNHTQDDLDDRLRKLKADGYSDVDAFANIIASHGLEPGAATMFTAWIMDTAAEHDVSVEVLAGVALTALAVGSETGLGGRLLRHVHQLHEEDDTIFLGVGPENGPPFTGEWLGRLLVGQHPTEPGAAKHVEQGNGKTLADCVRDLLGDPT